MYNRLQSMVTTGLLCIMLSQQVQANLIPPKPCKSGRIYNVTIHPGNWAPLPGNINLAPNYITASQAGLSTRYALIAYDDLNVYYGSSRGPGILSLPRINLTQILENYGTYQTTQARATEICP